MCHGSCLEFVASQLHADEVRGKTVLEVGARDVNGSPRAAVQALGPASYLGVDLAPGPGVDEVCAGEHLVRRYGPEAFDVVISTETLEHVRDWPTVIDNLKEVVKPGGILLVTTRSRGFPFHDYPFDFWRYEVEDLAVLFSDFTVMALVPDPSSPGVFFKGRKPPGFRRRPIGAFPLYSVITRRRTVTIRGVDIVRCRADRLARRLAWHLLPGPVHRALKRRLAADSASSAPPRVGA